MNIIDTQKKINQYFIDKLKTYGTTPKGVDYNSKNAQEIRFEQLVKVIKADRLFTLIDYGCGYGALLDYLLKKGWKFKYYGVDLVEQMIIAARESHQELANAHFTTEELDLPVADYLIAGAIFNLKLDTPYNEWQDFAAKTLLRMDALCTKGFSFNMLTCYSNPDRMSQRPDLFFGDPCFFFDYCKRNISGNVALLHDYEIFDFTILIRKDI